MKKALLLLAMAIALAGCSKKDETTQSQTNKEVIAITQMLNGKFIGSYYASATNSTWTDEITFAPYSETKKVTTLTDGQITAYGTAVVSSYLNGNLFVATKNCYYTVKIAYAGAQPTLTFYPYEDDGTVYSKHDRRTIRVLSDTSFEMQTPGSGDKIMVKQ